jgi:SAM-dependent methyltransferase
VLAAPTRRILERVATLVDGAPIATHSADGLRIVDVGCGAGQYALLAARRWPSARVIGVDGSSAMLSLARQRGSTLARYGRAGTIGWRVADAASLPLADASADLVLSSFMIQLVDRRADALAEMRRVLRPGGWLGIVGWLADDTVFAPDEEFDEAVLDLELEEPEAEAHEPDGAWADAAAAREELAAAGFAALDVRDDRLEHTWSRTGYRDFKARFDERDLFDTLESTAQERLLARVDERWAVLPDSAFTFRAPLVSITARRPVEAA